MKTVKDRVIELVREEFGLEDGVKFNMIGARYNPYHFENGELYNCDGDVGMVAFLLSYSDIEVIKELSPSQLTVVHKSSRVKILNLIRTELELDDGVEFFLIGSYNNPFYFNGDTLYDSLGNVRQLFELLYYKDIERIKNPSLTVEEREYLKSFVKGSIYKVYSLQYLVEDDHKYICAEVTGDTGKKIFSPFLNFKFEGLQEGRRYTLEELGL